MPKTFRRATFVFLHREKIPVTPCLQRYAGFASPEDGTSGPSSSANAATVWRTDRPCLRIGASSVALQCDACRHQCAPHRLKDRQDSSSKRPELTQRHTKLVQRMRLGLDGKDPEKYRNSLLNSRHISELLPCFKGAFLHVDDVSEKGLHLTKFFACREGQMQYLW